MVFRSILPAALCLACSAALRAASVNVSADDTVGVSFFADPLAANNNIAIRSDSALQQAVLAGDDLPIGNTVLVGFFNKTDAELQANGADVGYLISNFQQFGGPLKIGDNYPGSAGIFSNSVSGDTTALSLNGKQIYVFVLGSTDTSSFQRSQTTAFQVGIYYMDRVFDPDWAFPAQNGIPNSTTIDLADLTVGGAGQQLVPGGAHVVLGSFGPDDPNNLPGTTRSFSLASVPEPGSALLAVGGGLALLLRRRRQ